MTEKRFDPGALAGGRGADQGVAGQRPDPLTSSYIRRPVLRSWQPERSGSGLCGFAEVELPDGLIAKVAVYLLGRMAWAESWPTAIRRPKLRGRERRAINRTLPTAVDLVRQHFSDVLDDGRDFFSAPAPRRGEP